MTNLSDEMRTSYILYHSIFAHIDAFGGFNVLKRMGPSNLRNYPKYSTDRDILFIAGVGNKYLCFVNSKFKNEIIVINSKKGYAYQRNVFRRIIVFEISIRHHTRTTEN